MTGYVDVHEHVGDLPGGHGHGPGGCLQIDAVLGNEVVDEIELSGWHAVHLGDVSFLDAQAGLGVKGAPYGHQTYLGPGLDKGLAVYRSVLAHALTF